MAEKRISLYRAKFLELLQQGSWEYVDRVRGKTPVGIIATTVANEIILISQYRVPVGRVIIEIPAGLSGDTAGSEDEGWEVAARRELREETGYQAGTMEFLTEGPTSAGLTSECIKLVRATNAVREGDPTPDGDEQIAVHVIPLGEVDAWLAAKVHVGELVDPKVYAGLYFLKR